MRPFTIVAATTALAAIVQPAHAATVERAELYMSASRCQPSLPAFDGAIRKRPLAMQNEGTTAAFVTCGFDGLFYGVRSKKLIVVGLVNTGSLPVTVNCTLVDGQGNFDYPLFFQKSAVVNPGSSNDISYSAADNNGSNYMYPATSCSLPPGAGIKYVGARFDEEIGT